MRSSTDALIRISIEDMLEAAGLERIRRGRRLLEWLLFPAARRFTSQVIDYDRRVGAMGLSSAARFLLEQNVRRLDVAGLENIPSTGPLLLVSNHPGLADAMAIFSCLPRRDLLTVAADRPFLRALCHTSKHLIYLGSEDTEQGLALRRIAAHLRRGGSALIFPGGRIEPDPDVLPGATDSLKGWSKSVGLIVRLVRDVRVIPIVVRGVLSRRAIRHPLARLRRLDRDRERLSAMLQIIFPALRPSRVRVAFGEALSAETLLSSGSDAQDVTWKIIDAVRSLLESPPDVWVSLPHSGQAWN